MTEQQDPPVLRAKLAGMDCGSCALTIEDGLRKLPGVRRVSVDFTTETLEVEGSASRSQLEHRLRQLGYRFQDRQPPEPDTSSAGAGAPPSGAAGFVRFLWTSTPLRIALIATALIAIAFAVGSAFPAPQTESLLRLVLGATVVIVGAPIFVKGVRALVFSRRVTIELLMTLAALGAVLIGELGEAATVIVLFTFGEGLERFSAARARDSLRTLLALQPQTATVLRRVEGAHDRHDEDDGHDHDRHENDHAHAHESDDAHATPHLHRLTVRAEELAPGDLILIRPGERVAADGVIRAGSSSIDQAAVTGESTPISKVPGDEVMAGTVNAEGALEVEVTQRAADSTIARIAQLVERAQAQRSPVERFIDRFARWYTPAVIVFAILLVASAVVVFNQPLLDGADGSRGWLYRGLALLIVACPCALVISIPVTVVSSLTRLARAGVLVRGGEQLDRLAEVRAIAFDKTGTLTLGRPRVTSIQSSSCSHSDLEERACQSCDDVIGLAASLERSSEHPVAHAILQSARTRGLEHRFPPAQSVSAVSGRGIKGDLQGSRVAVGTEAFMKDLGITSEIEAFPSIKDAPRTVMLVAQDSSVLGAIGVQDVVREESGVTLAELRNAKPPVRTVMLTGDNERVAAAVARSVGSVDEVRAGLLPADKLAAIDELRKSYGAVAMVGDGINDTPALASADVGIAMGAGTAQAMETADVVLMQDDLRRVPVAMRVARLNRRVIKQNIALSLGLKLAFLALAVPGLATLWLAVAADVGATVLVTLNGMRMLRTK
jgi:Cd2+/Zn2+-exporting ATPase